MIPQLILTLSPAGDLIVELPGANGSRRQVPLRGDIAASIRRMLEAQLRREVEIGLDGAPTSAQVRHWERHEIWADPTCRFCIAEGRFTTKAPNRSPSGDRTVLKRDGIEVRRLAPKARGKVIAVKTSKSLAEMGL